jgi:hypothetical protein
MSLSDLHVTTVEHRGYKIQVYYDTDVQNPFEIWDCNPPIAVYSDRSITEYATKYGNVNSVPTLTREQIKANLSEILSMLEYKSLREMLREYPFRETALVEIVNEEIRVHVDNLYDSQRLETLETFYNMAGMPALYKQVTGPSQGDWAYVLAVAIPEFQKACGCDEGYWDDPERLAPSIQLFEDWAFGNVYGYVIEDADGEEVSSCWGFYGDYDDYMLGECRSIIDNIIDRDTKTHYSKLKAWIRHRVPLHYRTQLQKPAH